MNREFPVKIRLVGWFPDIYDANKPKDMSDESYVNAIITSWLIDRDEKKPTPKIKDSKKGSHNLRGVKG